jgi:hypothetical protein
LLWTIERDEADATPGLDDDVLVGHDRQLLLPFSGPQA